MTEKPPVTENEDFWRDFLTRGHSKERAGRRIFKRIPNDPRCRLCAAPFAGAGAPLMHLIGKKPSDRNPNWCGSCFAFMSEHHGGAEVRITMLFADIRGSTAVAEKVSSTAFRELVDRFYKTATSVVFSHDGMVDKFVGDELVAMFFPLLSGEQHAARAIDTARALLHATGHADPGGPWVPLGAGVHTGNAWVGALGSATRTEFTAVGDAVNTTARLASVAKAGEILVTADAAQAAGLDSVERTAIELKGKEHEIGVIRLTVAPAGISPAASVV